MRLRAILLAISIALCAASAYAGVLYIRIHSILTPQVVYSLRAALLGTNNGTTAEVSAVRYSDGTACDFVIATSGDLGGTAASCSVGSGLSIAAFAGTDATASCSISGNVATCSGASSTPNANDTITGAGITQPCIATQINTFTGGAGTINLAGAGSSPCGTIGSAETLTFTWGVGVHELYDLTGNGYNSINNTTVAPPYPFLGYFDLMPICANGKPGLLAAGDTQYYHFFNTLGIQGNTTQPVWPPPSGLVQPWTAVSVMGRINETTDAQAGVWQRSNDNVGIGFANSANLVWFGATNANTVTASDGQLHMLQLVGNGSSSTGTVDNSATTSAGTFSQDMGQPLWFGVE